jgi:hypothetical protein
MFERIKYYDDIQIVIADVCCFTNNERVNSNIELYKHSNVPLDLVKVR